MSCVVFCVVMRWQIWGIWLNIFLSTNHKDLLWEPNSIENTARSQDLSQRPQNKVLLACRQRRGEGIRERLIEMKCWWDDIRLQQRWAMQREKEHVFVVRLGGGIDLPSFWLTFFFRLSSSISFLPHTYSFPRPCSFYFPLFLSHTVTDQSLPSHLLVCLKPTSPTYTHTHTCSSTAHCP